MIFKLLEIEMEKDKTDATKVCSQCTTRKPLSAFSTFGGNICDSCKQAQTEEDEDSSSSSSGLKVDAKLKVQSDINKRKATEQVHSEYYNERATVQTNVKTTQNRQQATDTQRRRNFFERTRASEKTQITKEKAPAVVGGVEKAAEEARFDSQDTRVSKLKSHSSSFLTYRDSLTGSAPIKANSKKQNKPTETLSEVTKRNWGPRSK